MIGKTLTFVRDDLNANLEVPDLEESAELDAQSEATKVVFVDGDMTESIAFKKDAVTLLLINVEEERALRSADPYRRTAGSGAQLRIQPDIQLNLHMLFVARFQQYARAWAHLSAIISYFQTHRVIEASTNPSLPDPIETLTFELRTLGFAEQNEVWNSLRTAHHPSVLYKVRAVTFTDERPIQSTTVGEASDRVRRMD